MATYVLPQVQVYQDFQILPSVVANPLCAHITGGHAYLCRFAQATEQAFGQLDYYNPAVPTPFLWPSRPAGGIVDETYVKLWMKDALLPYFTATGGRSVGGIDGEGISDVIHPVSGYANRLRSGYVNFKSNGDFARFNEFYDRDVSLGDTVQIRVVPPGSSPVTLWTYVLDILGDVSAAYIDTPQNDENNGYTQDAQVVITREDQLLNCVQLSADAALYDGLQSGYINESYDIKVVASSVGGDLTTAVLQVISGSGTDSEANLVPNEAGMAFPIGQRGLTITFTQADTDSNSDSATHEHINPTDLIAGQEWRVTIHQAWKAPSVKVDADQSEYNSFNDTTYILTVVEGGTWANHPQIAVTTVNGVDMSGPTTVTGTDTGNEFAIGSEGLTVYIDPTNTPTGLRTGDRYYIEVIGQQEGAMKTLVLGHSLPVGVTDATVVDLTLYIREPVLQIPQDRQGYAPQLNWETTDTQITVQDGVLAYDETWTNQGVALPLPVVSQADQEYGLLFVEYRAWMPDLAYDVGAISDPGDIDTAISGALDPDNPLKWGVFQALTNANGTDVKFTAVVDPEDPNTWSDVLGIIEGRDDVYGLVPLSHNQTVLELYVAHVNDLSSPTYGLWRVLWVSLVDVPQIPVVTAGTTQANFTQATTVDGAVCLCTFAQNPETTEQAFTLVTCTSGNANFIANKVRPGDILETLWVGDGFGNASPTEFVVDQVLSEDLLVLMTGPAAPQTIPTKTEIWRNLNADDDAAQIALQAGAYDNRRVRAVWPDQITSGVTVMDGYHLCCALAGEASGILPHQGMTHLAISGFTSVPRTNQKFTRSQLDNMAVSGVWIVAQDPNSGNIFTRQAVTTGLYTDINQREEMLTRNVDSISFRFQDEFAPYIGVTNVTPSMQGLLTNQVSRLVNTLKWERYTQQLGGQLIDATIVSLVPSPIMADRYVLQLAITVPYAMNVFEVHLMI